MRTEFQTIKISLQNGIAVLTIDNPPVNSMSSQLERDLRDAFQEALSDPGVPALILTGTGKNFIAGADITTLQSLKTREEGFELGWSAVTLFNTMETASKPLIMAINGNCLGGGLEAALAGHYRVAVPGALLGLPEVQLGVIPGAGGIQRLPRRIGLPRALEMITFGQPVKAAEALRLDLVDEVVGPEELLPAALQAAKRFISGELQREQRMTRNRMEQLPKAEEKKTLIEEFKTRNAKKFRGLLAPYKALEAMEKGLMADMETDIRRDVELFSECAVSSIAKNLIGVFLNTRAAGRHPRIKGIEPAKINKVAMLGGGVMGSGIVHLLLKNGFETILWDIDEKALQKGLATVRKTFSYPIKQKKMTDAALEELLRDHLVTTTSLNDLKEADLVIEAVLEDLQVKQEIWKKLEGICRPETIFGTNTSALPITEMASVLKDPGRMIGLHFFNPAERMPLLEIICGRKTSDQTLATAVSFAKAIKKIMLIVNDGPGFYVTRQLIALFAGLPYLLADGVELEAIEQAVKDFGLPLGPAALEDLTGIDIGYHVNQTFARTLGDRYALHPLIERIYQTGCYGRKTKAGYYDYSGEKPVPNPKVAEVIRQFQQEKGVSPRSMEAAEIMDTLLALGINEAALIIAEGICDRSADMDLAMINGTGFPAYRGGILRYADAWGLKGVYEKLLELEKRYGLRYRPAALIQEMAESEKTFYPK
jgi:3-hydroxyacyl-CoA dehydrogenase/enoyl-CoA hydratase/carnithine racemase